MQCVGQGTQIISICLCQRYEYETNLTYNKQCYKLATQQNK